MSCFCASPDSPTSGTPDPTKHVNYVQGMILGVDDFNQEFAYLSERDQWLARDLLGYGTVTGLAVTIEASDKGSRVAVSTGVAISPRGQLIRVAPRQCAILNDWLNHAEIKANILPGTKVLRAYVVLCYRDCPTDAVPILGEPCRTEAESLAPSRIIDDFRLELRLDPPAQREEDAVRDFVAWLRQVDIADFTPGPDDLKHFLDDIRTAAHELQSPLGSPLDFLYGSPPSNLLMPRTQLCQWLRAAFGLWVTELRPLWHSQWVADCGCGGSSYASGTVQKQQNEEGVLLAEVDVPVLQVAAGWSVDPARGTTINEERRPYLLHLRMLQDWLICGQLTSSAPVSSPLGPAVQGQFVEHSAGAGRYLTVAAGLFRAANGAAVGPTYNNLGARPAGAGLYFLTFGSGGANRPDTVYVQPAGASPSFMYIVKGTLFVKQLAAGAAASFNVLAFTPTGIQIQITGPPSDPSDSFMIEISLFGTF
jgi:hypothetical protein